MSRVSFDVRGLPIAQGNARAYMAGGRAILATDANRTTTPLGAWRSSIATEARRAMSGPLMSGPLEVRLDFRWPRPKGHFLPTNSRRPSPILRLDAPIFHTARPDGDKVLRAALDALTSVVFTDDAQVARLVVVKRYINDREGPGVEVLVRTLEETR